MRECPMKSCGPVNAASAACCEMVQAPDVCCPCNFSMASISQRSPVPNPMRQAVKERDQLLVFAAGLFCILHVQNS